MQTANAPVITTYVKGHGTVSTGSTLVPGAGPSMALPGNKSYPWIKLREHPNLNLNGRNQFAVEAFVKLTQALNGAYSLVSSSGKAGAGPFTEAFYLRIGNNTANGDGKLFALLNVNGNPISLAGT